MKVYQVFESYPLFYQPYIPPVLDALRKINGLKIKVIAFKGQSEDVDGTVIMPDYRYRKLYEKSNQTLFKDYKGLKYLEIKVLKEKVDILHIQHSFLFPKIVELLKKRKGKRPKIIITLRGGDTYVKPWLQKRWKNFYRDYGNKVDAFIVMSEDQKKYIARWDVPLANIHVIPISFGERFVILPKYPNEKELKLVSVFRMCWEKNITDCLLLVKKLKELNIKVSYDLYGDGPDIGQLYYLRDKFGLQNEVIIHGKVANKELKNKLRDYDFLVQLSLSESLGMSAIEAQSMGLPVIVSNSDGLPEVVIDNETGFIIERENCDLKLKRIITIWENSLEYNNMSKNAITFAQNKFNINKEMESLINLYNNLI